MHLKVLVGRGSEKEEGPAAEFIRLKVFFFWDVLRCWPFLGHHLIRLKIRHFYIFGRIFGVLGILFAFRPFYVSG